VETTTSSIGSNSVQLLDAPADGITPSGVASESADEVPASRELTANIFYLKCNRN
jgi:hypothetical protein